MKKNTLLPYILSATVLAFAFSGIAFAENGTAAIGLRVGAHASTTLPNLNGAVQDIRANFKKEISDDRARIASTTKEIESRIEDGNQKMASTSPTFKGEIKTEIKNARQDMHVDIQTRMNTLRVVMMAKVVWIRINATIVRLEKIVTKLDSRIAKIKSAGGDTTIAEADSADAKTSLDTAQLDMDAIKTIISSISSTTPLDATATSTIKTDSTDAESQIKTAQNNIEKAVQSLQGLKVELKANVQASTTTSVETH